MVTFHKVEQPKTSTFTKKKRFEITTTPTPYVILPGFSLSDDGPAQMPYAGLSWQHWGYKHPPKKEGKDPYHVPFACPDMGKRRYGKFGDCEECKKIASLNERLKNLSGDEAEEGRPLEDWLKFHNLSKNFTMNVVNSNMELGGLQITVKGMEEQMIPAKDNADSLMAAMGKDGESISIDGGVKFWFWKEKDPKTKFWVYKVSHLPPKAKLPEFHGPIPQEVLDRVGEECFDLTNLCTVLPPEDITKLVKSEGDPEVVKEVFARARKNDKSEESPDVFDEQIAKNLAKTAVNPDVAAMSNEEFLKNFG